MKRFVLTLLFALPFVAIADEPPAGSRAATPGRVLWTSPEAVITLPVEDEPTTKTVEFPAVGGGELPLALRFRARFQWPSVGGVARNLGMTLNNQPLGPENAPVINRDVIETTLDFSLPRQGNGWWMPNKGWSLVLHYSSAPEVLEPRVVSDQNEGQWYLIQINGLTRGDASNQLKLINHAVTSTWEQGRLKDTTGVVIEFLSVVELERHP